MIEVFKKFVNDPEWHIVEEKLREFTDPLTDITTIDLMDESAVVKAEIKVRLELHERLESFLNEIGLFKEQSENKTSSFK
jgi:hypothetical protein